MQQNISQEKADAYIKKLEKINAVRQRTMEILKAIDKDVGEYKLNKLKERLNSNAH